MERTPDMEGLTPAERAAIYKQRRMAAQGQGGAPAAPAGGQAAGTPAAPAPTPTAPAAPAPVAEAPAAAAPAPAAPAASAPAPAPAGAAGSSPAAKTAPTPATPASAPAAAPAAKTAAKTAAPSAPEPPAEPPFVRQVLDAVEGATFQWRHGYAELKVPRERLLDAARRLFAAGFDYLSFITEVDWQDRLEMVYHLYAYDFASQPMGVVLRCDLPRDALPEVASLTTIWPGAEFMERECFEMMGIRFIGHPDLRRILLPDDFRGFPLRKDYETDFDYITVKHLTSELDPTFLATD